MIAKSLLDYYVKNSMLKDIFAKYGKAYTSFSGCVITANFGDRVIGKLQAIAYSVQRETAPVCATEVMGSRSISRRKHMIAGRLTFKTFNRDALRIGLEEYVRQNCMLYCPRSDLNIKPLTVDEWDSLAAKSITNITLQGATPVYADEIPPFDITVNFMDEYGKNATLVIYGVEILNEGSSFSIDRMACGKPFAFVARNEGKTA